MLLLTFLDVEGIKKTGSPNGERPVVRVDEVVDAEELDNPSAPCRPPALAVETKSALQANAMTKA